MAIIHPEGWRELKASGAAQREIETLALLAYGLPADYTVYHGVHWTRVAEGSFAIAGEIDFAIVGPTGKLLLVEQKSGFLAETPQGLTKRAGTRDESVPLLLARNADSLAARLRAALADEKQRVNLLVCMGLAGLLLLAVSSWLPADSSTQSAAPAAKTGSTADYAAELETRLTALISRVEGAGKTAVMVTLESGSESIYATDTDSDGSSTHVLLGSGEADGLVETVETPRVLGVAVVCEGGGSAAVQSRVTALVQALTGIGTNHITVAKMASAN